MKNNYDVKNLSLAQEGKKKIEWSGQSMKVLSLIKNRFEKEKPLAGLKIAACLHVTSETANLMLTLKAGGAQVYLCACNPLSTQDEVAASLVSDYQIPVYAVNGEDAKTYYRHIEDVLDFRPHITMDDGGDLITFLHTKRKNQLADIIGSNEETTTGVIRLKAMEKEKALRVPVIAINASQTKHMFDNRYGTGQSTIDGILRATNTLIAGKNFVVCGYGWCGRGVASRAHGLGAQVIVTEVDSVKALEAVMDGYKVMKIKDAAKIGDIFVTVTGDKKVITLNHIKIMKNGAILANSGHFNAEIEVDELEKQASKKRQIREFVTEYILGDRKIYLLGEGRLVNLVAAEGHPAEVMDMSFANQALAAEFLVKNKGRLKAKVYTLPGKLDQKVASIKLKSIGVKIDSLTAEQKKYLGSWQEGT